MPSTLRSKRSSRRRERRQQRRQKLNKIISNDLITRVSDDEYKSKVKRVYGGPQGALLSLASHLSLHIPLGERLFRTRKFDLSGVRSVLDVGSGAGQIARHLIKYCDPEATITCTDLSQPMLRRARTKLKQGDPSFITADLAHLPFADNSFDCVTCGYVLEHLPDPEPGLAEIARVLQPGGRMFLLTTEDNFGGAMTSRFWYCRMYNRKELLSTCQRLGLICKQEIWFTRMHKAIRAGGICVEIEKAA